MDVCGILPSAIKTECVSLVTEYGDEIVQMLVNELAPDVICVQLKLCGQNTQLVNCTGIYFQSFFVTTNLLL